MSRSDDFDRMAGSIKGATGAMAGMAEIAETAESRLASLNSALSAFGMSALQGFPMPGTGLDPGVGPGDAAPQSEPQRQYNQVVLRQFQELAARIKAEMGADNFIAREIDYTIGYLQDERLSGQDAIRRLQAILWNWQGGLFQEMSSQDRDMSQLAAELLRFISSGALQ